MKKANDSISLAYYVVGFFDLLGQQDHLRNLRSLPNRNDPEAIAETRDGLKNTYGAVVAMRQFFTDAFVAFERKTLDTSGLTPEQFSTYQQLTNNPIQLQGFSDSIAAYLSLTTNTAKLPARGVFGVFSAAATTFVCCLARGHPIRGGIDVGIGFEPTDGEIYGPALSRAYTLESKIANYPRIVVGDELIRYLHKTREQSADDAFAAASKKTAATCLDSIAVDDDGYPFIDYLGPLFRAQFGNVIDPTVIDLAYDHVAEFSIRFKDSKDTKLAFRYALLRNYFEARLPLWSDLPRKTSKDEWRRCR